MTPLEQAIEAIDAKNAKDPNLENSEGQMLPKELLYAKRMTAQLLAFQPDASQEVQIAARAQHICRWKSPREDYPMNRIGYLKWREDLKRMHANLTAEILQDLDFEKEVIDRVMFLIKKTWAKMSEKGQAAALKLPLSKTTLALVGKALA